MFPSKGQPCDRARKWVSLRLDGELSELESALLDAHLERCVDCSSFAADTGELAYALRTAPLEWAEPVVFEVPHRPRARASLRLVQTAAAATLVVAAALAGSLFGVTRQTAGRTVAAPVRPIAMVASSESADQLRILRRPLLLDSRQLPRNRSFGESV